MHEKPEILSPTEARQANRKRVNFRVLVTSLLLAAIVGAVLYFVFYNTGETTTPAAPGAPADTRPAAPAPTP